MKSLINDKLVDSTEAALSIYSLGLNRGYAVFDYFRIVDGQFRFFDDHLARFSNSIRWSGIPCAYNIDEIRQKIIALKNKNGVENGFVRITLVGGTSMDFASIPAESDLIIAVGESKSGGIKQEKSGVQLISKHYQRSIPHIKTTDYFFVQMHRKEMLAANAVDILYYSEFITETSRANVFFVKNDTLYTPKSNILEGITRKNVLSLYPDAVLSDISMDQLSDFDEAFICSSTKEITPVLKIDDLVIGNGQVGSKTREVMKGFAGLL